jgi:hypothetical protein
VVLTDEGNACLHHSTIERATQPGLNMKESGMARYLDRRDGVWRVFGEEVVGEFEEGDDPLLLHVFWIDDLNDDAPAPRCEETRLHAALEVLRRWKEGGHECVLCGEPIRAPNQWPMMVGLFLSADWRKLMPFGVGLECYRMKSLEEVMEMVAARFGLGPDAEIRPS